VNDRILEACLEEALGGAQTPDLTDKIVAALRERRSEEARERQSETMRSVPPAPRPIVVPSLSLSRASRLANGGPEVAEANRSHSTRWLPLALAASLVIVAGGYWVFSAGGRLQKARPLVAERSKPSRRPSEAQPRPAAKATDRANAATRPIDVATRPIGVATRPVPSVRRAEGNEIRSNAADAPAIAGGAVTTAPERGLSTKTTDHGPRTTDDPSTAGNALAAASLESALSTSATSDAQIIAYINAALKSRWKEAGVRPSPVATESEWCRRVYLDLIGRIPTIHELEAFLIDNGSKGGARNKRAKLVDRLLGEGPHADDQYSDQYVETFARYWTTLWTNLLIGRTGGMEPNSPVNREGLQQYLRRSFLANKPYNQFVYELISARGANRPLEVAYGNSEYRNSEYRNSEYNGAVNFLLQHLQERAAPATAKTAQIFLGLQLQCTQCHNHPFNDWKQNRFWELNAFFRQAREEREREGNQLKVVRLVDEDFAGEGGDPREAEVYFELRNGILQVAYPTFIDGTKIDPNGLVSVVDRRRELARLVSRSNELKAAIVNRLWAHFLGYGFTKPVDDLGPHNPPSHPELLARLGEEFAGHGYDLKRLMRWIVLSDAYALSSKFGPKLGNAADDPTMGAPPLFSHFYLRQMSAEQLYESLLVATGADRTQAGYEEQQRLKDRWLEQFAIAFGTDENDEATTFDGTIAQTLVMMNGELTRKATRGETGSFLSQLSPKAERALNELYLAALARRPSRGEVQVANSLLTAQSGNTTTALEDIWWALLNSNEFILNH